MITNIKKDLILNILTNGQIGKCDGCIARRGAGMAEINQVIYMTTDWNEKDYNNYKFGSAETMLKTYGENYCYYCAMDLLDNWRSEIRNIYFKKHQDKINNG